MQRNTWGVRMRMKMAWNVEIDNQENQSWVTHTWSEWCRKVWEISLGVPYKNRKINKRDTHKHTHTRTTEESKVANKKHSNQYRILILLSRNTKNSIRAENDKWDIQSTDVFSRTKIQTHKFAKEQKEKQVKKTNKQNGFFWTEPKTVWKKSEFNEKWQKLNKYVSLFRIYSLYFTKFNWKKKHMSFFPFSFLNTMLWFWFSFVFFKIKICWLLLFFFFLFF